MSILLKQSPLFLAYYYFSRTEDEFCAQYPGAIALVVAVPLDEEYAAFNFNGQRIEIEVCNDRYLSRQI